MKKEEFNSINELANYDRKDESSIGNHGFSSEIKLNFFKPVANEIEKVIGNDYFENIEGHSDEYDIVLSLWNGNYATGKRIDIKPGFIVKAWNGDKTYMADTEHDGSIDKMLKEAMKIM